MHAKLTANASIDKESFAKLMEDLSRRSGKSNVIDAKASLQLDAGTRSAEPSLEGKSRLGKGSGFGFTGAALEED